MDIGLGLRTDLTEKGLGLRFLLAGMSYAKQTYAPNYITLSVASFKLESTFVQHTNEEQYEFVKMKAQIE